MRIVLFILGCICFVLLSGAHFMYVYGIVGIRLTVESLTVWAIAILLEMFVLWILSDLLELI